jgi:hypothetical protein
VTGLRRLALLLLLGAAAAPDAQSRSSIDRLAWLQGCWTSRSADDRIVDEQWMGPRGGTMLGMSRTVAGGTLREYELVVIRTTASGLVYEAHPARQAAATFPVKAQTDASVVFENLAHDFPQRIGYRREGTDAVTAWVEGTRNGRSRTVEFAYQRARCEREF